MPEKVKVASIVVVFPSGERREMTLDEAKVLHAQLAELFGIKQPVISVPAYVQRDHWPRYIDPLPPVWCNADSTI